MTVRARLFRALAIAMIALGLPFHATAAGRNQAGQIPIPVPDSIPVPAPIRVVSVDFCADQYVLRLARRGQIAALSRDAHKDFSFLRAQAVGIKQIRPDLERIVALKADLVVRAYGGGPLLTRRLEQLGIRVVQLSFAEDFTTIEADIARVATALGREASGAQRIADMRKRLTPGPAKPARAAAPDGGKPSALYLSSGGAVAGPGTLPDEILRAAGFRNSRAAPGWGQADPEVLIRQPPAGFILSFFDLRASRGEIWSLTRHPVLRRLLAGIPRAEIPGAMLACPAWHSAEAVDILRQGLK